ncbi:hypothetical protein BCR15_03830 [Tessaracoccus lapidicaptus]|uniref:Uncharacterized protein n=1 Tax=Tessaracoccus lapidicaptus TaxID=1427523 RepID=A0A1C0AM07_9ACTN|nr:MULTISPECIES: SGNH/GDSL hydrolase family protein [Tessaracoccus]AQX15410.1 hypothetical protein BKM78_05345 [Tessaracoccus sp. T2.5-30]OCL33779.1 hypothetical protein BCR15_03830 [Tessaracoccus lapidicaptus]VEP39710.1 Lipase 1 [Tessaracoccus lapidicaptus]
MQHRLLTKGVALAAGLLLAAAAITPAAAGPLSPNRDRYAALGDSYAAGVGVSSSEAYPALLAGKVNKVTTVAESGATTVQVLAEQVPMVPSTAQQITLTVGGNDVGFIAVAQACASDPAACEGAIAAAASGLPAMGQSLATLIGALKIKAPQATIYVTGYPHVFQPMSLPGDMYSCPALQMPGMPEIDPADLAAADIAVTGLNSVIHGAAMATGAVYVDVDMPAGICTAPDMYIAATWDGGVPLHPTAAGQVVYAAAIEAAGFDD